MMDELFNKKDSRPPKDILQSLISGERFEDERIVRGLEKFFEQAHESGFEKLPEKLKTTIIEGMKFMPFGQRLSLEIYLNIPPDTFSSPWDEIQAESNLSDEQMSLLKNLAREIVKSRSKQNLN